MMNYVNLDLQVTVDRRETNSYQVIASTSGRDRRIVSEGFFLPIGQRWDAIEQSLIELGARPTRDAATTRDHARQIRDFGKELFQHLINGEVRRLYDDKKREAERNNRPLRLRLTLVPFELVVLPWELLYDGRNNEYLCLTRRPEIILIRGIENTRVSRPRFPKPSNEHAPLRILGMIADPRDQERLRGAKEKNLIEDALRPLRENQRVKLDWANTGKYRDLFNSQNDADSYDVFHFIGHGRFDQSSQQGQLVFEKQDGNSEYISARQFGLALHRDLQLVVLNACETARGNPLDRFSNLAYSLAENGIPAVVAMQFKILDEASLRFTEEFYTLLEKGEVIEEAVAQARRRIYSAAEEEYRLDWAAPLLYTSSARSISLRPPARQQVSRRVKIPAEGVAPSAREAKTIEPESVIEPDPVEKEKTAPVFISGGWKTRGTQLPNPPSWLTGRGLSREKKTVSPVEPPPLPRLPRRFRPLYLIMTVLFLLGLLLLIGYLKVLSSPHASITTICLATDLPLFGGIDSGAGLQVQNGIELAYEQSPFDESKVYENYQLKLYPMNDINSQTGQSDPNLGANNLQGLFQENSIACPNPIAIIGPVNSSVAVAEIPIAVQKHILLLSPSNTAPCLTLEQYSESPCDYNSMHGSLSNTYARLPLTDEVLADQDASLLTNDSEQGGLGAQKIVIVGDEETYGTQLSQAVIKQLEQSQVTSISVYCIESADAYKTNPHCPQLNTPSNVNAVAFSIDDLSTLATKIRGKHPDAVFFGGLSGNGGGKLRNILGSKIPFVGGDALVASSQDFFGVVGSDAANIYATFPVSDPSTFTSGPAKTFYDQYQSKFNSSPGPYSAYAYDATNIVIQTIEKLISERQPVTKDTVVNAVFKSPFTGVTGNSIEFSPEGDNTEPQVFTIYQSQSDRGWKVFGTGEAANYL